MLSLAPHDRMLKISGLFSSGTLLRSQGIRFDLLCLDSGENEASALHAAAYKGSISCVRVLLKAFERLDTECKKLAAEYKGNDENKEAMYSSFLGAITEQFAAKMDRGTWV